MLEVTIGAVPLRLRMHTSDTRLTEIFYIGPDVGPSILSSDELKSFVLTKMSQQNMVMFVLHDFESEVVGVGDINSVV